MVRLIHLTVLLLSLMLAGCAGTIQRESMHGMKSIEGASYKSVRVVMTDQAKALLADNPQFSADELAASMERALKAAKLLRADGKNQVEVTVEAFYVRNMVTALVLSFVAGPDSIDGYVRVFDDRGAQLHAYKVNASYSFGGVAGSLDSMRMAWMYDKFSELTVAELTGTTPASDVTPGNATAAQPAAAQPAAAQSSSAAATPPPATRP